MAGAPETLVPIQCRSLRVHGMHVVVLPKFKAEIKLDKPYLIYGVDSTVDGYIDVKYVPLLFSLTSICPLPVCGHVSLTCSYLYLMRDALHERNEWHHSSFDEYLFHFVAVRNTFHVILSTALQPAFVILG